MCKKKEPGLSLRQSEMSLGGAYLPPATEMMLRVVWFSVLAPGISGVRWTGIRGLGQDLKHSDSAADLIHM